MLNIISYDQILEARMASLSWNWYIFPKQSLPGVLVWRVLAAFGMVLYLHRALSLRPYCSACRRPLNMFLSFDLSQLLTLFEGLQS